MQHDFLAGYYKARRAYRWVSPSQQLDIGESPTTKGVKSLIDLSL